MADYDVEEERRQREGEIVPSSGIGTAPIWKDLGGMVEKVVTPLGVGGAALVDTGTGLINYLTGTGKTNYLNPNLKALRTAYGLKQPSTEVAAVAPTTVSVGSPGVPKTEKPDDGILGEEVPAKPAKPSPAENDLTRFGTIKFPEMGKKKITPNAGEDLISFANRLDKDAYKEFVDLNEDDENFRGFGYVLMNDSDNGKKRLEKVIGDTGRMGGAKTPEERRTAARMDVADALDQILTGLTGRGKEARRPVYDPATGAYSGGVDKESMTAAASILGHQLTAESNRAKVTEDAAYRKDRLAEDIRYHTLLTGNEARKIEHEKFVRDEATKVRREQGEEKMIEQFGKYEYEDELGNKVRETSPSVAIFKLIDSGVDMSEFSKKYQDAAKAMRERAREFHIKAKAADSKLTNPEIKAMFYDDLRGKKVKAKEKK